MSEILQVSLNADQMNYIAGCVDSKFNIYNETGFGNKIAIPSHAAAQAVLHYFRNEEVLVELFEAMLNMEGLRKSGVIIKIIGKDRLFKVLYQLKWIYDEDIKMFLKDPFYVDEINLLNEIRFIDLRNHKSSEKVLDLIKTYCDKLQVTDLEWQITIRMYRLDSHASEIIRQILIMILNKQNLGDFVNDFFVSLRELALNASKANFKNLFEKYIATAMKISAKDDYLKFLEIFKQELYENGDQRLIELAKENDKFFDLKFKSTKNLFDIWVTNYSPVSVVEKKRILSKLDIAHFDDFTSVFIPDELAEGAGLGINIVLTTLNQFTTEKKPLKVVFYPEMTKIGFEINRTNLKVNLQNPQPQ